ncbi:MAG: leucine-rich repeat domain-containing protein [Acetatifactor sp.]|nr:leucine-rich repeat domain-containing protein [Acetatifactor sp.]
MDAKMRNTRTTWLKKYCRSLAVLAALLVLVLCPVRAKASSGELTPEILRERLEALMVKYPDGRYWNHLSGEENNPEGTTDVPCLQHMNQIRDTCNVVEVNGRKTLQCWGFANKLSYELYGDYFENWTQYASSMPISPGDVLQFGYTPLDIGHTVMVLGISGDDVYVVDCNSDSHCKIRWWGVLSKAMVKEGMGGTYSQNAIYHAPMELPYPEGYCGLNATYDLDADGTLTIHGKGKVFDCCFENRGDVKRVIFEDGITGVGSNTFEGCSALEEVVFPDSMEVISEKSFANCTSLAKANVPAKLKEIGAEAFSNTILTSFVLPQGMQSVGNNVFFGTPGFCGNYAHYTLEDGLLQIMGTGEVYRIAFRYRSDVKQVYVGEGITSIGYGCFDGCTRLEYLELPESLTLVSENAFFDCDALTDVFCHAAPWDLTIEVGETQFIWEPVKTTRFHVHQDFLETYQLLFAEKVNATIVGDLNYSGRETEVVEQGVGGDGSFYTLYSDGRLIIEGFGKAILFFSGEANPNYTLIKNVTFDGMITDVWCSFDECTQLESVTLSKYVEYVRGGAFYRCPKLSDIYCYADVNYMEWPDWGDVTEGVICHVYSEDLEAWKNQQKVEVNLEYAGDLQAQEETRYPRSGRCGVDAYYEMEGNCLTITGTGDIQDNFFYNTYTYDHGAKNLEFRNSDLNKIVIGDGITEIGSREFYNFNVTEIVLPEGLLSIGIEVFSSCSQLQTLTLPYSLKEIKKSAFSNCTNISEFSCLANPEDLTWETRSSDFKPNKATICHVPSNYLKGYQKKFGNANVTFVGDLAPELRGLTFIAVEAREPSCEEDGSITYYLGSDDQIYVSKDGVLLSDQNGDGVVDLLDAVLPKGHAYTENSATWKWEKTDVDFAVTVSRKCMRCGAFEESVPVTVQKTESESGMTYVATASIHGTEVSMTREVKNDYYVTIDGTSSTHAFGDRVTVYAAAPSEGMVFAGWYEGETLVCTSAEIDFLVSRNIALHTVYVDASQYVEPIGPILNFDLSERVFDENGNQKLDMTVTWYVLDGMTVKDVGLVRTTDEEAELSIENEEVKRRSAGVDNASGTFIHHLTLGAVSGALTAYAKAYLVFDDARGEEHVLYTERQSSAPAVRAAETAQPAENAEGTQAAGGNAAETAQPAEGTGEAQPTEE